MCFGRPCGDETLRSDSFPLCCSAHEMWSLRAHKWRSVRTCAGKTVASSSDGAKSMVPSVRFEFSNFPRAAAVLKGGGACAPRL